MNILDKIVLEKINHTEYLSQKINKKRILNIESQNTFLVQ